MNAIDQILGGYRERREARHRNHVRRQLRMGLLAAVDALALASFARMSRRRRLAFAAAEVVFADRVHRHVEARR